MAVGKPAVPIAVLDIEGGAGGDELLGHERVAVHRGRDERSSPAEKSAGRFKWRAADAVGTTALPVDVVDIEGGAGGDELLDHGCVALECSPGERSAPGKNSAGRF